MPIIIERLKDTSQKEKDHIFKDLHLDIEEEKSGPNLRKRDIKADKDLSAIVNSLRNVFNTVPGQKPLNPTFGLDLRQFLYKPITETTGNQIGDKILSDLKKHEPRVRVNKVRVVGSERKHQYTISLQLAIPTFGKSETFNVSLVLDQNTVAFT